MELRHIRYFLAVAAERNFTRAAAVLGIAQPPLSQQIRSLEDELGAQLFHRVPHGAELTAAGEAFLVDARLALAAAERARNAAARAHRGEVGRLILGFTPSAAFNSVVSSTVDAFHLKWPNVALSLEEIKGSIIFERMLRGELDAAFVRPGADDPPEALLRPLDDEAMVIALPANHALAKREGLCLRDLAKERFVLFPRDLGRSLRDEIVGTCRALGFSPNIVHEALGVSSVVNLVAAHIGVSIVPVSITQIKLPGVVYRPIAGRSPIARLAFATIKGARSPMIKNFVDLLP